MSQPGEPEDPTTVDLEHQDTAVVRGNVRHDELEAFLGNAFSTIPTDPEARPYVTFDPVVEIARSRGWMDKQAWHSTRGTR